MTPAETARILAAIQARDLRTVGEVDVRAWHEDIGDLDYADCLPAVSEHFRNSEARIMPVHVRRIATERRRERAARERTAELLAPPSADVWPPGELHRRIEQTRATVRAAREARVARGEPAYPRVAETARSGGSGDPGPVYGPTGSEPGVHPGTHGPTDPDDDNRIGRPGE